MNLGNLIPHLPQEFWKFCADLGRERKWMRMAPHPEDNSVNISVDIEDMSEPVRKRVASILMRADRSPTWGNDVMCLEAISAACTGGVKMVRVNGEQCEALEQVEVRLKASEYQQPYTTMVVRYPPEYVEQVSREHAFQAPDMVIVRHHTDANVIFLNGFFGAGIFGSKPDNCLIVVGSDEWTVEDSISRVFDIGDVEACGMRRMYRVAMNMLLLVTDSSHILAPTNTRMLERARKRPELPSSIVEVATHIYDIGISHITVRGPSERGAPLGGTHADPRPHWRKGHWRMQRYGPGYRGSKRIFIRPVFVNAEGEAPSVVYSMR